MTATPTPDPEARCSESRIRKINADEARECLSRFVASHFRDGREHARFTIPADVNRDDDLLLGRFIDDSAHALAATSALLREARTWLRVLADDQELMEPPSAYTDLLTRIDRELAKEANNGQ